MILLDVSLLVDEMISIVWEQAVGNAPRRHCSDPCTKKSLLVEPYPSDNSIFASQIEAISVSWVCELVKGHSCPSSII